jgi:Flp pilus assembly protein TadD
LALLASSATSMLHHASRFLVRWSAALLLAVAGSSAPAADALQQARELQARGQLGAALRQVDEGLAARSGDAQLRFLRGVLLMDLQRHDEALQAFRQMALEWPELPDPLNNVALLLARNGQLDEARSTLEAALRNDPGHRAARGNLAQVHLMLAAQQLERLAGSAALEAPQQRLLQAVRNLLK